MSDMEAGDDLPEIEASEGDALSPLPKMAGASSLARDLYERGRKQSDEIDFAEIENRRKEATRQKIETIRRGREALMAAQRPNEAEALLAMSRGFLAPTRAGSFAESLGNVAGEMSPVLQRRRQAEDQLRQQLQQFDERIPQAELEGLQSEEAALLKRAAQGKDMMTRAAQIAAAEARAREQAQSRKDTLELRREMMRQGDAARASASDARAAGQMATATGYLDEATLARLAQTDPRAAGMKPGAYIFQYNKADPANSMRIVSQAEPKKQEQPQKLSATEQKEIIESMDAISAGERAIAALGRASSLNDSAYAGFFAGARAALVANARHATGATPSKAADDTKLYETIVTEQALSQLKSIFGAAPTEGERKILTEMQASVDKTPAQRKAILERAVEAANARIASERRKLELIKTGEYKTPSAPKPAAPDTGLSKEAEEILQMYSGKR